MQLVEGTLPGYKPSLDWCHTMAKGGGLAHSVKTLMYRFWSMSQILTVVSWDYLRKFLLPLL